MFLTTGVLVDMFSYTDEVLDMFPHTDDINSGVSRHVESIALLQRMSNTWEKTITLDVEMEDYHRIKSERREV